MRERERLWQQNKKVVQFARESYEQLPEKRKDYISKRFWTQQVADVLSAYCDFVEKEDDRSQPDAWKAFQGKLFTEAAWYEIRKEMEKTGVREVEKYLRPFFLETIRHWKKQYNEKVKEIQQRDDEIRYLKTIILMMTELRSFELKLLPEETINKEDVEKGRNLAIFELTQRLRDFLKNRGFDLKELYRDYSPKTRPTSQKEDGRTLLDLEREFPIPGYRTRDLR